MNRMFKALGDRAQRGSKPRCHLLTHGPHEAVAARLTSLAAPFAVVAPTDRWMPQGFVDCGEAELDKADRLLDDARRRALAAWWLPAGRKRARTPNFDVASTCMVEGQPGLLLIEAKAHDNELRHEAIGRSLPQDASDERRESHPIIGAAIEAARIGLTAATARQWGISRDSHYQLSNRFAWSWKLAELGVPVVLIYLGFLHAEEMSDKGRPFSDGKEWTDLVLDHAMNRVPADIWGRKWSVAGVPFVPLIRTVSQPLEPATA